MNGIKAISTRLSELEARCNELDSRSRELDAVLEELRLNHDPFDEWWRLEKLALLLSDSVDNEADSETAKLAKWLGAAHYEQVVYESETSRLVFGKSETTSLDERIEHVIANEDDGAHRIMFLGAALLQLFIQANWTGPPVPCFDDASRYPLPYLPREEEMQGFDSVVARLEEEARATAAASGKDKSLADLDRFPRLHAQCAADLEINGESVYDTARGLHFLHVAVRLLRAAESAAKNPPLTSGWWRARCATVYQESLSSREVAYDLKVEAETYFARCYERLIKYFAKHNFTDSNALGLLHLERGVSAHKFKDASKAKLLFAKALEILQLDVKLSGALGKRTKFQMEDKSQLVLLASSSRTKNPEAAVATPTEPMKDGECAGFGTVVEAGHVRVRLDELDIDNPLHERIQFVDSTVNQLERKGHLHEIDQVAVLDLCIDVKNSYAMERLTAEEMLAYCERVTENPDNWTIHGCALLIKSKLEFEKFKTKERSVLQMQLLVDQQTNRLTPLQYRIKDITEDSAAPLDRIRYVHALVWPPVWRLKRGVADRYRELGVLGSALNVYQELRMWEDAVGCLVQMDKRHRAETLIRERLAIAPTPNLYVTLGELINDDSLLEKAWETSNRRYARAKRLLGAKAYDKGDYQGAREHLNAALAVNAQFPWAWFRLGAASMRLEDWATAKKAYATVVSLEPEDAEGWGNLSACLSKLGEIDQALRAIHEATKFGFGNARIWDSMLTLALKAQQWDSVIHAMDTLIDLEGRKSGAPRVDVRALLPLTEYAIRTPAIRVRFEQLIAKIKAKCQSQADVWALVSEYFGAIGRTDDRRDALVRRCRALIKEPEWYSEFNTVSKVVLTALALLNSVVGADANVKKETVLFITGFLDKMQNWQALPNDDLPKRDMVAEKLEKVRMMMNELSMTK